MSDPDVPTADALEQAQPADETEVLIPPVPAPTGLDLEVPEADALEQAAEVPSGDDER